GRIVQTVRAAGAPAHAHRPRRRGLVLQPATRGLPADDPDVAGRLRPVPSLATDDHGLVRSAAGPSGTPRPPVARPARITTPTPAPATPRHRRVELPVTAEFGLTLELHLGTSTRSRAGWT